MAAANCMEGDEKFSSYTSHAKTNNIKRKVWRDVTKVSKTNLVATPPGKKRKLKVDCLSFTKTRIGAKYLLPNEATLSLNFLDPETNEPCQTSSMPILAGSVDKIEFLTMPLVNSWNKYCNDLFLEVRLKLKTEKNTERDIIFYWKINFNPNASNDMESSASLNAKVLPNMAAILYADMENKVNKKGTINGLSRGHLGTEIVRIPNQRLPPKSLSALASLKLMFSWKKSKNLIDRKIQIDFDRKFWLKTTAPKLPVTYVFRLSAHDDVTVRNYSFDCVWCKWQAGDSYNLSLHYKFAHPNFIIDFYSLSHGPKFEVHRKILPKSEVLKIIKIENQENLPKSGTAESDFWEDKEFLFVRRKPKVVKSLNSIAEGFEFCPELKCFEGCEQKIDVNKPRSMSIKQLARMANGENTRKIVEHYYTGRRGTKILNQLQENEDSDEDCQHVAWQHEKSTEEVSEFVDVSEPEKKFISLWNKHRLTYSRINGDVEMFNLITSFVYVYHKLLTKQDLLNQLSLHVVNVFDHGCLKYNDFRQLVCFIQTWRICPEKIASFLPTTFI